MTTSNSNQSTIMEDEVRQGFRLSPQQRHLWRQQQAEEVPYRVWQAVSIEGQLDAGALQVAVRDVIARHEILRTTFQPMPGMDYPVQVIHDEQDFAVQHHDLSELQATKLKMAVEALLHEASLLPFAYSQPPLLRVSLARLSATEHLLLLSLPALCADSAGLSALLQEISRSYAAAMDTKQSSEEVMQYADVSEVLNELLESNETAAGRDYWLKSNFENPTSVKFPLEERSGGKQGFEPRSLSLTIDPHLGASAAGLAAAGEFSVFEILQACWHVLLWKFTGQSDLIVGTAYAGRTYEGLDNAPGLFSRYLPLSCHLEGDYRFSDILPQLKRASLTASEWQEYFTWEQDTDTRTQRHTNAPYFPLSFEVIEQPAPIHLAGLHWTINRQGGCTERFDIKLRCVSNARGELRAEFHYDEEKFSVTSIERLARHFHTLLSSVIENSSSAIAELEILDDNERQRLLNEYNPAAVEFASPHLMHELFEAQVLRSPHALALISEQEHFSYLQLNERANQLAHLILTHPLHPDAPVALLLERSPSMLISILAVLKAGAAYLPLDPQQPHQRLSLMLAEAAPALLISDAASLPAHSPTPTLSLPDQTSSAPDDALSTWLSSSAGNLPVMNLDTADELLARQPTTNPARTVDDSSLAYLIYTSGSTGRPKAVAVSHRAICNRLLWMQAEFPLTASDRVLQKTAYSFDASIWEMFVPLLSGAQVVLAKAGGQKDSGYLVEVMEREGVTVLQMVPSMLSVLVKERGIGERCAKLRRVFSGGEALSWELEAEFYAAMREAAAASGGGGRASVELVNLYGPTEASIDATMYRCERTHSNSSQAVPIGRPISNVQVYILDAQMKPLAQGVAGELYIGGAGLARGYLNRPELTAERFIPHPFSVRGGERVYRTGDIARHLPDGRIEFLGRSDQQVKVRGFRIETGEIAASLTAHPGVEECVVVVREDVPGEKRLVAYLVVAGANRMQVSEWRAYLKEILPDYMIPSAFVILDHLPLMTSGKLDKNSLPVPEQARLLSEKKYVAPRTPVEETLAEIWSDVLRLPQVGVDDNFFDLGGDSIRSIQVKAQAQKRGLEFSIEQLFQNQTIAELSRQVQATSEISSTETRTKAFDLISEEDRLRLPDEIEDAYPLAMLQAGMFFHREYSPESALYHDIASYHLKGRLDIAALRLAVRQLAFNHPVLRTSFDLTEYSEPLQLVHRATGIPLEEFDLSHLSDAEQRESLDGWMEDLTLRRFDLSQAPLLRFIAHRRGAETLQFTMNCHHAILDGWSVAAMVSELFHLYFHFLGKEQTTLAPPVATYRDFIALEQKALASVETGDYWMRQLNGSIVTMMPRIDDASVLSDYKRQPIVREVLLSPEVSEGLRRLARVAGMPLRSVLLAAHLRVMSFLGGRADVMTGLVSNCRPEEVDGERALGLFLNTVPFRMNVEGGTWVELAQQTFAAEREMLPHRWFPLAEIQQRLGIRPLFEAVFNFIHFHIYDSVNGFDDMQPLASRGFEQTNYPLTASFIQGLDAQPIAFGLECDPAIFSEDQVRAILQYYNKALETMSAEPEARYENCTLLSDAEQHQAVKEWNETHALYTLDHTLHSLFEQQVERTPLAMALISDQDGEQLSYSELNERANQLAQLLISSGITPESLVALLFERSTNMLVSILAVLKTGAAYLPLDPEYPAERLSFMLKDASPALLITQSTLALDSLPVINLDTCAALLAAQPTTNPSLSVDERSLAYIIYTSGSTGRPKAVAISHHSICNRLLWMQTEFPLTSDDRVLQKTAYSFDASIWEIFVPLMSGARVVLAKAGGQRDSAYLVEVMEREAVTVLQLVPSMLGVLLGERGLPERCRTLKRVFSGGEALTWETQEQFFSVLGAAVELVNLYGPTEASIDASYRRCSPQDPHRGQVMIGRAISNMELYVLDERGSLTPTGVAGELYLGGAGLARGYVNRAEMTAERFLPHPFSEVDGERLYRTGDVVRRMWDGELEYVGRADQQVKLRGYRIELGEVEAALRKQEGVTEAVVMAREDEIGDQRLVAYIVAEPREASASEFSTAEVRDRLLETLPDYMVPSAIVVMEQMPRLANSKIDRHALPPPDGTSQALKGSYVAPRTPVEEVVAGIWAHVLRVEQVSIHDDFFMLGGHSLTATQVFSRIRETFQIEMPLRTMFDEPTVHGLSRHIEAARQANAGLQAPPISRVSREGDLPLSFAQQRLWFMDQLEPGSSAYNLASAIRLKGSLNVEALQQSMDSILSRHEALRTTFTIVKGRPVQVIMPEFNLSMSLTDLRHQPEAEREASMRRLATEEAHQPFDLTRGPLLRTQLLRLGDDDHLALLTMHHIISDGWSIGVFVRELSSLYESFARGESPQLPELTIQYADYAAWQRGWLQGEVLDKQVAYWKQQLADAPAVVELPTDYPRPTAQTFNGANLNAMLPKTLTDALKALSQREGVSLFITLLAAFQTLISIRTGSEHVVVGTDVANRNRGESEGLIGFFVNQLVLSANLSGNPRFRQSLRHVRDITLDAFAHQDLPFDKLVELLPSSRDLSRTPLFQLKMVFQNAPLQPLELEGLTLSQLDFGAGTAKYDLTLFMEDTNQGLSLIWQYNSDLFAPTTIDNLADQFALLLDSIVAQPDAKLTEFKALLNEAEKERRRKAKTRLELVNFERFKSLKPKSVRA